MIFWGRGCRVVAVVVIVGLRLMTSMLMAFFLKELWWSNNNNNNNMITDVVSTAMTVCSTEYDEEYTSSMWPPSESGRSGVPAHRLRPRRWPRHRLDEKRDLMKHFMVFNFTGKSHGARCCWVLQLWTSRCWSSVVSGSTTTIPSPPSFYLSYYNGVRKNRPYSLLLQVQ